MAAGHDPPYHGLLNIVHMSPSPKVTSPDDLFLLTSIPASPYFRLLLS